MGTRSEILTLNTSRHGGVNEKIDGHSRCDRKP